MTATTQVKTIPLSTGVRLEYVEQGDLDGIPVIMLHGLSDSWHSYELVLPHLPQSIHAFALTQRGHGDSDKPAAGYLPGDFAADIVAFMDAMGLPEAIIAGHSNGSVVARQFANDFPGRTRGLVLAGAFQDLQHNPDIIAFSDELSRLDNTIDPTFVREFQESTLTHPVPPAFLDTVVRESLKAPAHVWKTWMRALIDHEPSPPTGTTTPPTLIIWGDGDLYAPRLDQDALHSMFSGSRLLIYEGIGHALHWEDPERFAADLVRFVERVMGDA